MYHSSVSHRIRGVNPCLFLLFYVVNGLVTAIILGGLLSHRTPSLIHEPRVPYNEGQETSLSGVRASSQCGNDHSAAPACMHFHSRPTKSSGPSGPNAPYFWWWATPHKPSPLEDDQSWRNAHHFRQKCSPAQVGQFPPWQNFVQSLVSKCELSPNVNWLIICNYPTYV
jgi:hypothetical protein